MTFQDSLRKFSTGSPAIASYDAVDFADGAGMVTFLGANTKQQTTDTYILTRDAIFSNDIGTETSIIHQGTSGIRLDLDFDLSEINIPRDIEGTAFVTATLCANKNSGDMYFYYIAKIKKNDDVISSAQYQTRRIYDETVYCTDTVKIELPLTHFSTGDTLRLTMEVYASISSLNGCGTITLFHDPADRSEGTADTTQLKTHIPFKINE